MDDSGGSASEQQVWEGACMGVAHCVPKLEVSGLTKHRQTDLHLSSTLLLAGYMALNN